MHGMTMIWWYASPILSGLAIYMAPLMIGSRDMAFPRLNAFTYWTYLFSGILLYVSPLLGQAPHGGWFAYAPYADVPFSPGYGMDFFNTALVLLTISTTGGAINFIVTILRLRAPGMVISKMPLFLYSTLTISFVVLFSLPSLTAANIFLELDRRWGFQFFKTAHGGNVLLWQQVFWFFGHPWVYDAQVFASIAEGRGKGMPALGHKDSRAANLETGRVHKVAEHAEGASSAKSSASAPRERGKRVTSRKGKWWMTGRCIPVALLLLLLPSCQSARSTLHPGGPAAGNIAWLEWTALITFCIVSFIMWALLLWTVTRKRGSLAEHAPWNTGGGQAWIAIGGFAIPFVVLCSLFVLGLVLLRSFPIHEGAKVHPTIRVIGHQWWWEIHYIAQPASRQFTTANEIHIPVGKPIDIELDSADVIHSFWIPRLHGKVDLNPGQRNYIRIQADAPGNYSGQCAEYCGEQHAHMQLLVVAQSEQDYEAWYRNQLNPAQEPEGAEAIHGRDVFVAAACAFCHEIRGTDAHGHVAPDLTHLASRQGIASKSYANNKANLAGWVVHAQSLKPGSEMPDLAVFNGPDLRALVEYLQQLK